MLLAGVCVNAFAQTSVDPHATETKEQRDARMKWWREARFGMFIHWGSYSVPGGIYDGKPIESAGEWIMRTANIPVDYYAAYAKRFNPQKFNANEWVAYAKAAGMKYIVMTAKHHEGFAMYPSKVDSYNIYDQTEFKRDPVGEMTLACRKAGIKFGVYYSQNLDWHHPGGGTAGPSWDPKQKGSFHDYVMKVSAPQVHELLTIYKPAVLWWDINANFTPDEVRALTADFANVPKLIANNRLGGGVPGDTETPEQFIPATGYKGRDWETCMTMNDTWGFKSTDMNFKSTSSLVRNLVDIASKGGNYLLNVGPTSEGLIPSIEVERLAEMGKWMAKNGRSIYATTASPYRKLPFDGRATVKGHSLFLNVFDWPAGGLVVPGLQTPVVSAQTVVGGQRLAVRKLSDGSLTIERPTVIDMISTAIELKLVAVPVVSEPEPQLLPKADGSYELIANEAVIDGGSLLLEGGDRGNLGYWVNASDKAYWTVTTVGTTAKSYEATLEYACEPGSEGSTFVVKVDGVTTRVTGRIEKTAGWQSYTKVLLEGQLTLTKGKHKVEVVPITKPALAVMNLRTLYLRPATR